MATWRASCAWQGSAALLTQGERAGAGLPGGLGWEELACNSGRSQFIPAWMEDPSEKEGATTPVFLAQETEG